MHLQEVNPLNNVRKPYSLYPSFIVALFYLYPSSILAIHDSDPNSNPHCDPEFDLYRVSYHSYEYR